MCFLKDVGVNLFSFFKHSIKSMYQHQSWLFTGEKANLIIHWSNRDPHAPSVRRLLQKSFFCCCFFFGMTLGLSAHIKHLMVCQQSLFQSSTELVKMKEEEKVLHSTQVLLSDRLKTLNTLGKWQSDIWPFCRTSRVCQHLTCYDCALVKLRLPGPQSNLIFWPFG